MSYAVPVRSKYGQKKTRQVFKNLTGLSISIKWVLLTLPIRYLTHTSVHG